MSDPAEFGVAFAAYAGPVGAEAVDRGKSHPAGPVAPEAPTITPSGPRERILHTAADLFSRKGIRAVGVDTIVTSARVAKASFYHHYQSKDDLVVAWLRSDDARWLDRIASQTEASTPDPHARLLAFFDAIETLAHQPGYRGCAYLNTAAELRDEPGPARDAITDMIHEIRTYLEDLARAADLRAPEQLSQTLQLLLAGAFATTRAVGNGSPATVARHAAATLIDAARQAR